VETLLLAACSTVNVKKEYATVSEQQTLEARYYNVDIPMRDGISLRATVYQPELTPDETAPLLISAHGFGGFRTSGPVSFYGQFMITGEATLNAWRNKYWVISIDQRGFGQSGGEIEMMQPEYEPHDVMEVITWANRHLPRLARENPDDPLVGMVGESWGGGVQLLASIFDDRIDAIVPITTWNNLARTLAPNDQVKTYWGALLVAGGGVSSFFDFGKIMRQPYASLVAGTMTPDARAVLERASPSHYCAQNKFPQADMLLLQGFTDTMMTMNEAVENQRCGLAAGLDVRLVAIQKGHRLPWPTQPIDGMPLFSTDAHIDCGEVSFDTHAMIQQWLDLKLKHKPEAKPIPAVCATLPEEQRGRTLVDLPVGGERFALANADVYLIQTGWFELVMNPLDKAVSLVLPSSEVKNAAEQSTAGGFARPLFVPLWVARRDTAMIGIPKLDVVVSEGSKDNRDVVYAAVAVRKGGSVAVDVVSDQFFPLVGNGRQHVEMPGISALVEKNDTVGLVLQGYSGQFFFNPEGWFGGVNVAGEVQLPLLNPVMEDRSLAVK
jgi:ABC-2 type transport system ATP-binding protein